MRNSFKKTMRSTSAKPVRCEPAHLKLVDPSRSLPATASARDICSYVSAMVRELKARAENAGRVELTFSLYLAAKAAEVEADQSAI